MGNVYLLKFDERVTHLMDVSKVPKFFITL